MKTTCYFINNKHRLDSIYEFVKEFTDLEITGMIENMSMITKKHLPMDFNPEIVFIDFPNFKKNYDFVEPLLNKTRLVFAVGLKRDDPYPMFWRYKASFIFLDKKDFHRNFYEWLDNLEDFKRHETFEGMHGYKYGNSIHFQMDFHRHTLIKWDEVLTIRKVGLVSYIGLADLAYFSMFPFSSISFFNKWDWVANAERDIVVNLNKVRNLNVAEMKVTLVNGEVIKIRKSFLSKFEMKFKALKGAIYPKN